MHGTAAHPHPPSRHSPATHAARRPHSHPAPASKGTRSLPAGPHPAVPHAHPAACSTCQRRPVRRAGDAAAGACSCCCRPCPPAPPATSPLQTAVRRWWSGPPPCELPPGELVPRCGAPPSPSTLLEAAAAAAVSAPWWQAWLAGTAATYLLWTAVLWLHALQVGVGQPATHPLPPCNPPPPLPPMQRFILGPATSHMLAGASAASRRAGGSSGCGGGGMALLQYPAGLTVASADGVTSVWSWRWPCCTSRCIVSAAPPFALVPACCYTAPRHSLWSRLRAATDTGATAGLLAAPAGLLHLTGLPDAVPPPLAARLARTAGVRVAAGSADTAEQYRRAGARVAAVAAPHQRVVRARGRRGSTCSGSGSGNTESNGPQAGSVASRQEEARFASPPRCRSRPSSLPPPEEPREGGEAAASHGGWGGELAEAGVETAVGATTPSPKHTGSLHLPEGLPPSIAGVWVDGHPLEELLRAL